MKQLPLILLFFLFSILAFGQTISDQEEVIQKCIDLDILQPYFQENELEGRKPLIISDNGNVRPDLKLTKFDEPVLFMTTEELFFYDKSAYLEFEKFDMDQNRATIVLNYTIEGLSIFVVFNKKDNIWQIESKKLNEQK